MLSSGWAAPLPAVAGFAGHHDHKNRLRPAGCRPADRLEHHGPRPSPAWLSPGPTMWPRRTWVSSPPSMFMWSSPRQCVRAHHAPRSPGKGHSRSQIGGHVACQSSTPARWTHSHPLVGGQWLCTRPWVGPPGPASAPGCHASAPTAEACCNCWSEQDKGQGHGRDTALPTPETLGVGWALNLF